MRRKWENYGVKLETAKRDLAEKGGGLRASVVSEHVLSERAWSPGAYALGRHVLLFGEINKKIPGPSMCSPCGRALRAPVLWVGMCSPGARALGRHVLLFGA